MTSEPFVLDGFDPIKLLGSGGFGDVWLARQTNIDRKVAIKVGHSPIEDPDVQLRFERECIALGRLSGHPNIIEVFTAGRLDDGRPYLVLEYVNGGTLWRRLKQERLDETQLIRLARELADALSVAHTAGVLHRDIKPENVFLRANGQAVIGDFGLARLHDGANTSTHGITASVAYAPPEILTGSPSSTASDLYGIGICVLSAAIGTVPFVNAEDSSVHPIITRVLNDKPVDLRTLGFSDPFVSVIDDLLEKDPERRPLSAEVVKQRLDALNQPVAPITVTERAVTTTDSIAAALSQTYGPLSAQSIGAPQLSRWDRIRLIGAAISAIVLFGSIVGFVISRL
ncbi:MAG: serine/threonine-protein kinase [Actinomycetota bacterium]